MDVKAYEGWKDKHGKEPAVSERAFLFKKFPVLALPATRKLRPLLGA